MSYNGWTNYETWAVALWIDNEQNTERAARRLAQDAFDLATATEYRTLEEARRFDLADTLKEWVTDDLIPDLGASLASDLLGAALSEVDWNEIADHYLADLTDDEDDEGSE